MREVTAVLSRIGKESAQFGTEVSEEKTKLMVLNKQSLHSLRSKSER